MRRNVTIGFSPQEFLRLHGAAAVAQMPVSSEAAGAEPAVGHDPAGDCGTRRAGRMQMKREPRRWRDASKAFLSLHGVTRKLPQLCKRPACSKSEPRRGLTCIRWGAYGAAGFSGVKDARRASSLPTLQRRLTDTALRLHSCCKSPAFLLHKCCN